MVSPFITDKGVKVPAITAQQMREVDRIAIEGGGPNLFQMMENAGRCLAILTMQLLGSGWQKADIIVVAGSGDNGGGGICAARHLANRNARIKLCITNPDRLGAVQAYQRQTFQFTRGIEINFRELGETHADFILDAIIGYSLNAAPYGNALKFIQWANSKNKPGISLDVPSGVEATEGITPGQFIRTSTTMTLALPKTGLLPELTGELFLADIGIPEDIFHRAGIKYKSPFDQRYLVPISIL